MTSTIITILCVLIYIIIAVLVYKFEIKNWDVTKFETIYFAAIWPLMIPLWIIDKIHNM
jgi:hypothetical protein